MKSFWLVLTVLIFSCNHTNEQKVNIGYFGQKPPIDTAELFAPGIIDTGTYIHSAPAFSTDGKTMLWADMQMPSYHTSILEVKYENGKWSLPQSPSFVDSVANYVYPSFSPDGKQLYFSSDRRINDKDTLVKGNRLSKVERNGVAWGEPILLDSIISRGGEYASSIAENGNLYFTHGPHRSPDWNIYKVEKVNDKYSAPTIFEFNSTGYEDGPFVAPDESYLIFESDKFESINGSIDLFICFKNKIGQWTKPKNMGTKINTPFSERFSRVSPDGKYLFFGSNKIQNENRKGFDIYWIDAGIIDELKKEVIQ
jgi:hypothetical protein